MIFILIRRNCSKTVISVVRIYNFKCRRGKSVTIPEDQICFASKILLWISFPSGSTIKISNFSADVTDLITNFADTHTWEFGSSQSENHKFKPFAAYQMATEMLVLIEKLPVQLFQKSQPVLKSQLRHDDGMGWEGGSPKYQTRLLTRFVLLRCSNRLIENIKGKKNANFKSHHLSICLNYTVHNKWKASSL